MSIAKHLGPLPPVEEYTEKVHLERQAHWASCASCKQEVAEGLEKLRAVLLNSTTTN